MKENGLIGRKLCHSEWGQRELLPPDYIVGHFSILNCPQILMGMGFLDHGRVPHVPWVLGRKGMLLEAAQP